MKNPHDIIIKPHITEKSVGMSYGDEKSALKRVQNETREANKSLSDKNKKEMPKRADDEELVRKYTFIVAQGANKIEIKQAIEAIYNAGKKEDDAIKVTAVHTVNLPRKKKRRGNRAAGFTPVRRKAVVTLAKGQMLEDYGV